MFLDVSSRRLRPTSQKIPDPPGDMKRRLIALTSVEFACGLKRLLTPCNHCARSFCPWTFVVSEAELRAGLGKLACWMVPPPEPV